MLDETEKFEPFQELSKLRTFLPFRWSQSQPFNSPTDFDLLLRRLVRLRVLSLSNYVISGIPESTKYLKHLRFLNLSCTEITHVPENSVGSLYNLQTLLLSDCHGLTTLPTDLPNLTKLRHLDVSGTNLTKMPPNFGGLKSLRLLTTFVVSKDGGSSIKELGAHQLLCGSLSIEKLENVINATDASEAKLQEMKFLDELALIWTNHVHNLTSEENVLNNLQPHKYLRKFKIENYGGKRFPDWLGNPSFSNMVSIHLIGCRNCSSLPQLGQLFSLEILHVAKMTRLERVNPDFYGNGNHTSPFRSLKVMSFEDMFEWKEWLPVDGVEFPSLEELMIEKCGKLKGDLSHRLPALNNLVISGCHSLTSLPKVPILEELEITYCNSWKDLPAGLMQGVTGLSKLILST
ncbi:hypothetical protein L6164_023395, partial [Bauhinia variegata]